MSIDEAAFERDLKTLSKADLLKKYPASKLHPDVELMVEVVGDEMGKINHRMNGIEQEIKPRILFDALAKRLGKEVRNITDVTSELLTRIEALEQAVEGRQNLILSVREMRIEVEATVSDLRHEIVALKSEVDLLRSAVPPSNIKVRDAARLLREVGEQR